MILIIITDGLLKLNIIIIIFIITIIIIIINFETGTVEVTCMYPTIRILTRFKPSTRGQSREIYWSARLQSHWGLISKALSHVITKSRASIPRTFLSMEKKPQQSSESGHNLRAACSRQGWRGLITPHLVSEIPFGAWSCSKTIRLRHSNQVQSNPSFHLQFAIAFGWGFCISNCVISVTQFD